MEEKERKEAAIEKLFNTIASIRTSDEVRKLNNLGRTQKSSIVDGKRPASVECLTQPQNTEPRELVGMGGRKPPLTALPFWPRARIDPKVFMSYLHSL